MPGRGITGMRRRGRWPITNRKKLALTSTPV
jgi:hypothetical protein